MLAVYNLEVYMEGKGRTLCTAEEGQHGKEKKH